MATRETDRLTNSAFERHTYNPYINSSIDIESQPDSLTIEFEGRFVADNTNTAVSDDDEIMYVKPSPRRTAYPTLPVPPDPFAE
jgi:hypothetical protein